MSKALIGHDIGQYTFNAVAKTITFVGLPTFGLEQILLITNTTSNIIIYNFADPTPNGGTLAGNILTLDYNTASMSNTDPLQIYIDLPSTAIVDQAAMNDSYTHLLLERIADLLEPIATQDANNRQRVSVDAITATLANVTTVGTVSALTGGTITTITNPVPVGNVATIGSVDPRYLFIDTARNAYAQGIRSNLAFGN